MLLKELPQGSSVYVISNGNDGIKAFQAKIASESGKPHYKGSQNQFPNQLQPPYVPPVNTEIVVDVYVDINGEKLPFEINENASFSRGRYASKNVEYFISVDREPFLREIQALKIKSEEYLKGVDINQKNVETCNKILEEWDPAAAEKKKNDDRLKSMENRIGGMENMIKAMYEQFKKSEK